MNDITDKIIDCRRQLYILYNERELRKDELHLRGIWVKKGFRDFIRFEDMTDNRLNNSIKYFERKLKKLQEC